MLSITEDLFCIRKNKEVNFETVSMRSSMTSFDVTSVNNLYTDNVSQSDFGGMSNQTNFYSRRESGSQKISFTGTIGKKSSFTGVEYDTNSFKNYFENSGLKKETPNHGNNIFDHTIAEMPNEEEFVTKNIETVRGKSSPIFSGF